MMRHGVVDDAHFLCHALPTENERLAPGRGAARRCFFRFVADLANEFDDPGHLRLFEQPPTLVVNILRDATNHWSQHKVTSANACRVGSPSAR
jgi:hypothetical protein